MRVQTAKLDLSRFRTTRRTTFLAALDDATDTAVAALPKSCRHWGLARKGLNIFLRDCLYTHDLRQAYSLALAEEHFELPLDSLTAKCLRKVDPALPRWRGVRALSVEDSIAYQHAARSEGSRRSLVPVHLDAFWWGQRDSDWLPF